MHRRRMTLATAVLGVPLVLGSTSSGVQAATTGPGCPDRSQRLTADDLQGTHFDIEQCGLGGRVVTNGTVSVTVPAPGTSLIATAETTRSSTTLVAAVSRRGALRISQSTQKLTAPATTGSTQPANRPATRTSAGAPDCTDHEQPPIFGFRDKVPDPFYLGQVSGVSVSDAETTLRSVVEEYNSLVNPCGVPDQSTIELVYAGRTQAPAQVTSDLRCTQPDGQQTVAFQPLDGALASTCTAMNGTAITDWDMAVNSETPWWTSGSCPSGAFELRSNLAHEFGHVVGLDHYTSAHRNLLMYGGLASCEQRSQLGWGEATMLNRMY